MKRGAAASGPSVSGLQRDLQLEQECRSRLEDSVEQLRLELQMMGRLLAAAREQVVASGAAPAQPGVALRVPPPPPSEGQRSGRSKSDARLLARLHEEVRVVCRAKNTPRAPRRSLRKATSPPCALPIARHVLPSSSCLRRPPAGRRRPRPSASRSPASSSSSSSHVCVRAAHVCPPCPRSWWTAEPSASGYRRSSRCSSTSSSSHSPGKSAPPPRQRAPGGGGCGRARPDARQSSPRACIPPPPPGPVVTCAPWSLCTLSHQPTLAARTARTTRIIYNICTARRAHAHARDDAGSLVGAVPFPWRRRELAGIVAEVSEYLSASGGPGI